MGWTIAVMVGFLIFVTLWPIVAAVVTVWTMEALAQRRFIDRT